MVNKEFNFIKRSIDALPIPEGKMGRARYYDSVMRGLCIRVTGGGKKSFYFYRKINNRVVSQKLGDYPDMSIEQARGKCAELNGRIAGGEKPWELKAVARAEMTLESLFAIYIDRHAKKTRKTWKEMIEEFDRYAGTIRKHKLSEITHELANKLHGQIGHKGTYSANRFIQLLRSVYNRGIAWKIYDGSNPFADITLFPEKPRENFLTNQQAGKLLQALYEPAEDKWTKNLHDFLKLSLFLGIRKSNLANLRWSDISFENDTLVIPDTKNGTPQLIALGHNELEILKDRRKNTTSVFVFPGRFDDNKPVNDLKRGWHSLRNRLGIPDCRMHDLRRSLGSALANSGTNIALVKSILHHKDQKTTLAHYAFATKDAEKRARESVQKDWLEAARKETSKVVPLVKQSA